MKKKLRGRPSRFKKSMKEIALKWGVTSTTVSNMAKKGCNFDWPDETILDWIESEQSKKNKIKEHKAKRKEKPCSKCKKHKQRSDFNTSKTSIDGLTSRCKLCLSEGYQQRNKDKINAHKKKKQKKQELAKMRIKTCSKCKKLKNYADFHKNKTTSDGLVAWCKSCLRAKYQKKNKDKIEAKNKRIAYNKKHKKAKASHRAKERYQRDIEASRAKQRESDRRRKAKRREYDRKRRATDPVYRATLAHRARIRKALINNSKSSSSTELTGCSIKQFRQNLESQFTEGMSWDNYGKRGWHIDHIIPCASFDLSDPAQQRACFHYTNQQPLWAKNNESKGDRIPDNHQPELPINYEAK